MDAQLLLPSIGLTLAIAIFGTALVLTQVLDNAAAQSDEYEASEIDKEINAKFDMLQSKNAAVYHKMEDDLEACANLPVNQEVFDGFESSRKSCSPDRAKEHLVLNMADSAIDTLWKGYKAVTKILQNPSGKPQLKKIEGEGAESEEEFEYAEGSVNSTDHSSSPKSPRSPSGSSQLSNRKSANRWSSLLSAED